MLDFTNRLRNFLGNYRYVAYQMRLWKLQGHLLGSDQLAEKEFISLALKQYGGPRPWTTLDLGCGDYPRNPFGADHSFGCDIREDLEAGIKCANLSIEPIPEASESLDFITAYDFIEHIPRVVCGGTTRLPFVELMSEIYRVLKPGGFFFSRTPSFPSNAAFQDPTHVNIITNETLPNYFCWHPYGGPWARIYGFKGRFVLVKQRKKGPCIYSLLQKEY